MSTPKKNMYGCLPCPKCGSTFRASYRRPVFKDPHPKDAAPGGSLRTIECDDCGFKESAPFDPEYDGDEVNS